MRRLWWCRALVVFLVLLLPVLILREGRDVLGGMLEGMYATLEVAAEGLGMFKPPLYSPSTMMVHSGSARTERQILLSFNGEYTEEAQNLLESIRVNIPHLVNDVIVCASDDKAEIFAKENGLRSFTLSSMTETGAYRTAAFNKFMKRKMEAVLYLLTRGMKVLYTDTDVVFLKDPTIFSPDHSKGYSLLFQIDGRAGDEPLCAGFFFADPTEDAISFVNATINRLTDNLHDQDVVNMLPWRLKWKAQRLDLCKFPNGARYFDNDVPRCKREEAFIVHNNFIQHPFKKDRMIKNNLWFTKAPTRSPFPAPSQPSSHLETNHFNPLRASRQILIMFNGDYVEEAQNLLESMRVNTPHLVKDVIVCVSDDKSGKFANDNGLRSFALPNVTERFNITTFNKFGKRKMEAVLYLLTRGMKVLYTDTDVVFLKDPTIFSPDHSKGYSTLFQIDGKAPNISLCTGFFFVDPTKDAISLFNAAIDAMARSGDNDQTVMNRLVIKRKENVQQLDECQFPNGVRYFNHDIPRCLKNESFIVHNNWIARSMKKDRLIKNNLWFLKTPSPSS